jgi:hypothetical protein
MFIFLASSAATASAAAVCDNDNVCEAGENVLWCANDCLVFAINSCGDGFCDPNEQGNCAIDCPAGNCTPTNGGNESCDGVDNNCDGLVDDGLDLICSRSPTAQNLTIPSTASQVFTIRIANPNIDLLAIKWYDNSASVQNDSTSYSSTYIFQADTDMFCSHAIKVVVNDTEANYTAEKEWQLNITGTNNFTLYRDADSDGYGDSGSTIEVCDPVAGYVNNSDDCDDSDSARNPGEIEVLDGKDNDCNAVVDDISCSNETQFLGGNFQISNTTNVWQEDVAFSGDKYFVVWDVYINTIVGQLLATDGTKIGPMINISTQDTAEDPVVAYHNGTGRWLVAWLDSRANLSDTGIYGRLLENDGTPVGDDFLIYDGPYHDQYQWAAAVPSGFFVVYEAGDDIHGRVVNSNGVLGPDITISNATSIQAQPSAVYAAEQDRILVTWYDYRDMNTEKGTDSDIYGQLLDGTGNLIGENFIIYDEWNYQTTARAAYNSIDNTFLVIFDDQTDYLEGKRISAQKVAINGSLIGEPVIVSDTDGGEEFPAIAYNPNVDKYLGVWTNCGDVFAQIFDKYSLPLGADIVLSNATNDQCYISVTHGPGSTFLAIWFDKRTSHSEVWGQIISAPCKEVCSELTYYEDADGDGYGNASSTITTCGVPEGYVSNDDDCDDSNPATNPGASEICDGKDNNCDTQIDEGLDWIGMSGGNFQITTDADKDGYVNAAFGDDKYLAIWSSNRTGENRNLFGKFVGAGGSIIGSDFAISEYDAFQQISAVKYNPYSEKWLVVWNDDRVEGDPYSGDLYGRLINKDGPFAGDYFVISAMPDAQTLPAIAALPGKFLVVWEDARDANITNCDDVYAQMISSNGALIGSEIVISNENASCEGMPDAAYDPVNDRVLVSWEDWRNESTTGADIYARFIDSNGSYIGGQFAANDDSGNQQTPSIAYNSKEKSYLVTNDGITGSTRNIRAQKLAEDGSQQGASYQVSDGALMNWVFENVKTAYNPVINKYLMVWADNESSPLDPPDGSMEIFGQFANGDGTKDDSNIFVTIAENSQSSPAIAAGPGQDFLVLWADYRDGGNNDIWGQRVQGGCEQK